MLANVFFLGPPEFCFFYIMDLVAEKVCVLNFGFRRKIKNNYIMKNHGRDRCWRPGSKTGHRDLIYYLSKTVERTPKLNAFWGTTTKYTNSILFGGTAGPQINMNTTKEKQFLGPRARRIIFRESLSW